MSDASLFGRINAGNAVSYPLGLNFGWAAGINLLPSLDAAFLQSTLAYAPVYDSLMRHGKDAELAQLLKKRRGE